MMRDIVQRITDVELVKGIIADHEKEVTRLKNKVAGDFSINTDSDESYRLIRMHEDLINAGMERVAYIKRKEIYEVRQKELEEKRRLEMAHETKKRKVQRGRAIDRVNDYVNTYNSKVHNDVTVNLTKEMSADFKRIKKKKKVKKKSHRYIPLTMLKDLKRKNIKRKKIF